MKTTKKQKFIARSTQIQHTLFLLLLCLFFVGITSDLFAQQSDELINNRYDDQRGLALVQKMIEAHGGYDRWLATPSITFKNEVYDFKSASFVDRYGKGSIGIYKYRVSIKPKNSLGYAHFMLLKGDNRILYDGTDIIGVGFEMDDHNLDKSPALLLFYEYALINLPWLTQVDGVKLKYAGTGRLPWETGEYEVIKMTFEHPGINTMHEGYFELYIDPDTGLLKGIKQTAIFPKLPGTQFSLGVSSLPVPLAHIIKGYTQKHGLLIPDSFVTFQNQQLLGVRFIHHSSFKEQINPNQILTIRTDNH